MPHSPFPGGNLRHAAPTRARRTPTAEATVREYSVPSTITVSPEENLTDAGAAHPDSGGHRA